MNSGPVGHRGGAGDLPSSGGGPSDSRFGDLANPAAGCVTLLDGVPTFCDFVTRMGNGAGLQLRVGTTKYDIQLLGGSSTLWVDAWEEFYIPGKGAIGHDENGNDDAFDAGTTGIRNIGYFMTISSGAAGLGTLGPGVLPQNPHDPKNQTRLTHDQEQVLRKDTETEINARKDCMEFIAGLLFTVGKNTQRPLYSSEFLTDPIKVIDAIESQGGFIVALGLKHPGEAWGALGRGTAAVAMISFNPGSSGNIGLAELLHHSGTSTYSDQEMAWAAYEVLTAQGYQGLPAPPKTNDIDENSKYFHNEYVFRACSPNSSKIRGVPAR